MTITKTLLSDRTGLLGAAGALLTGLPPWAIYSYLLLRAIIPVLLIVMATHSATPTEKIGLIRDYLLGREPTPPGHPPVLGACCDPAQSGPDPSLEP